MGRNNTARTPSCLLDSGVPVTQAEGRNGSGSRNCVPSTNSPSPADKLDLILQEIREFQAAIEHCVDTIAADLGILKDDHKKSADKVTYPTRLDRILCPTQMAGRFTDSLCLAKTFLDHNPLELTIQWGRVPVPVPTWHMQPTHLEVVAFRDRLHTAIEEYFTKN
ncbi:hypothetical protein NDU88_006986 [Pleurodeles waltl]|uniref:Uncharacterized protein n=1 Tax=Pleurodeles waltl TaxID=8319 RepID=A0AAV7VNF1_PLEWA|nr:hypothetical protein NDU88_006986 [Pleurodeles waltl]